MRGKQRWRRLGASTILAGLLASAGCSLTLSGPPPRVTGRTPRAALTCDTGKGLVAFDSIVGTAIGIGALNLLSSELPETAAVPAILSLAFLGAALRGNAVVNECRDAHEELRLELVAAKEKKKARGKKRAQPAPSEAAAQPGHSAPVAPVAPPAIAASARPPVAPAAPRPVAPAPAAAPRPAPSPTAPAAPPAPPTAAPTKRAPPAPAPPPDAAEDPWADFWTEVP